MLGTPIHFWVVFLGVTLASLAIDLGVFHRKAHRVQVREALLESACWIAVSLAFNVWIYYALGKAAGLEFLTGYLVEKSLSVDNIFVFLLIFQAFRVKAEAQHTVLFYGVAGALVMRAAFVLAGVELLQVFHSVLYVFGAFLLITGIRMFFTGERKIDPQSNWMVRAARRVMRIEDDPAIDTFFVKRNGQRYATHLLLALVAVEAMDLIFAVDSVPAVLAITRNPFIVYSSNAFAILGLRALYFALADLLPRLRFLHQGLAAILIFVGAKMIASEWRPVPAVWSLGVIAAILFLTLGASLWIPAKRDAKTI
jgi:tellurite resistance protein TerC